MDRQELLQPFLDAFNISIEELIGNRRTHDLTDIRKIVGYELRKTGLSFPTIGRIMERDHSTVMYQCTAYEDLLKFSPKFRELTEKLKL